MSDPDWDAKYASAPDGLFGADVNAYVRSICDHQQFPARRALFIADGDGRNSRWFASRGGDASAVDLSSVAVANALRLDRQAGVQVDRHVGDVTVWQPTADATWGAVFLIYLQAPWSVRRSALDLAWRVLRPGGWLVVEGFAKAQSGTVCGPANPNLRYSVDEMRTIFPDAQALELSTLQIELDEGARHQGRAVVLRACLIRD